MTQVIEEINQLWETVFKGIYNGGKREQKTLVNGNNKLETLVIFNERTNCVKPYNDCPFDNPGKKSRFRRYRGIWFGINTNPVEEKHVILFPSKHREWPTEEDFNDILNFTSETEYTCSLNLKLSGAQIVNHVHFQGVTKNFPCFEDPKTPIMKGDGIIVYRLLIPYCGILIYTNSPEGRKRSLKIGNLRRPYNAILKSKNGETYIFIYPRNGIFSPSLNNFKIGGPEMARLFYAKNFEQYQKWNHHNLIKGIQEVSLRGMNEENEFKKELLELIESHN